MGVISFVCAYFCVWLDFCSLLVWSRFKGLKKAQKFNTLMVQSVKCPQRRGRYWVGGECVYLLTKPSSISCCRGRAEGWRQDEEECEAERWGRWKNPTSNREDFSLPVALPTEQLTMAEIQGYVLFSYWAATPKGPLFLCVCLCVCMVIWCIGKGNVEAAKVKVE